MNDEEYSTRPLWGGMEGCNTNLCLQGKNLNRKLLHTGEFGSAAFSHGIM